MKKFILAMALFSLFVFAQVNNSPNMNLPIPIPGQTSGPQWAQDINASLTLIDQHNHTPGQGVQIPPAGLNINTNLSFSNNSATNLQASVYTPQGSYSTNYGVHVEGVDLYYVDGNGNDIKMTAGGTVNATSSGISSGTATASFVAGVLVVNSASNTPANIQAGSYLMGNNLASSKLLTLQPPNAMAANYSVTLPSLPASQSFMAVDTSGNMTGYAPVSAGLTGANIAANTISGSNLINNTLSDTQIQALGITAASIANATLTTTQIAADTVSSLNMGFFRQGSLSGAGTYSNSSNAFTNIASGTYTMNGTGATARPLFFGPAGTGGLISIGVTAGTSMTASFQLLNPASVVVAAWTISYSLPGTTSASLNYPASVLNFMGSPGAYAGGANTWVLQGAVTSGTGTITILTGGRNFYMFQI